MVQIRCDARDVRLTGDDEPSAAAYYMAGATLSAFLADPQDRWNIAAHLGWTAGLFLPCGFFLLIAAAVWYAARSSQFR